MGEGASKNVHAGDLCTSFTIDNLPQSAVGKVIDALRDAGFQVEINVGAFPTTTTEGATA